MGRTSLIPRRCYGLATFDQRHILTRCFTSIYQLPFRAPGTAVQFGKQKRLETKHGKRYHGVSKTGNSAELITLADGERFVV